jgi:outer membrane protein OmpA-like peptidoglycan-associated protein
MAAEITYSELGSKKVIGTATSNPETGIFIIALQQGKKYSFNAHHKGFAATHYNFDAVLLKKYKEENVDLYLTPLEEGQSIVMNNLFFVANKYEILPESYPELDKLYDLLKEHPTIKIEIAGHTSANTSGEKFNQELSTNRALAVKEYVVRKGIAENRISHVGHGYSKPIFKEEKEELQARNRRVEFKIISK